ncbi:MAG TPA: hypothetical protein VG838_12195 [Opitutaceae bacterium]|nr:hypothetical protein [Opitutaceae bacterium]
MYFFVVAFGLLLHVLLWGAGLAALAMPRPWRRCWPVLAGPAGLALQSLVVWTGAYANLPGTDSYAMTSELLPVLLLAAACWRRGARRLTEDVARLGWIWLAMAVCLCALVLPLVIAAKNIGLTTFSLGSCDAADYAAGARVLKEFAHSDHRGFLGLTEVVSLMSVDNFFDFWLRLNHFTPSALIALNGTILRLAPHEITSLLTMVLLVTSLPVVFWMARAVMRYRPATSAWIALLYGLSPVTWYAVFHVAMGQLIAAQAIALITWAGVALWRSRLGWRRGLAMSGVLAIGYALVLGGYNFILLVCLVQAGGFALGLAIWDNEWRRLARWSLLMVTPLIASALVFWDRVAGLVERYMLFQQYDFGWRIPALSPAGWVGFVAGPALNPLAAWPQVIFSVAVIGLLMAALVAGAKQHRRGVFLALCLCVPVLLGYGYLNLRGVQLGTNASYDAYKLFAVFYPGLLAAFCYWMTLASARRLAARAAAWTLAVAVTAGTLNAAYRFAVRMERPPLIVDGELIHLQKIEDLPGVASLNMLVPDMWSRLWANAFLLRKPQYFVTHTYEGRKNTPLRGEWDLNAGLIEITLPNRDHYNVLSPNYSIVKIDDPYYVRASLGDGWYEGERLPHQMVVYWHWTKGDAAVRIENPHDRPLRLVCQLVVRSLVPRDLQVWMNGKQLRTVKIDTKLGKVRVPEISIPPGGATLELRSNLPPTVAGPRDTRLLGFEVHDLEIDVLSDNTPPEID